MERPSESVNRLIDTASCYVRTIYNISEDGQVPRRARIIERLGQAGPTVSQTVARLERDGLVTDATPAQHLVLTPEGRRIAIAVTRKHRLAERMLADILGIPAQQVHEEASRWEHVMSDDAERGIIALLENPTESPWGNPIPGLDELGVDWQPRPPGIPLVDFGRPTSPVRATVRSISEQAQDDQTLMGQLISAGIIPGAKVRVEYRAGTYVLRGLNSIDIPAKRAHIIQLERG